MSALKVMVDKGHELRIATDDEQKQKMLSDAIKLAEDGDAKHLFNIILLDAELTGMDKMLKRVTQ